MSDKANRARQMWQAGYADGLAGRPHGTDPLSQVDELAPGAALSVAGAAGWVRQPAACSPISVVWHLAADYQRGRAQNATALGKRPMAERYAQQVIDDVTRGMPQTVVTLSYAAAIIAETKGLEAADWPAVNRTIADRWSLGALGRIKRAAWKRVNSESRSGDASDG